MGQHDLSLAPQEIPIPTYEEERIIKSQASRAVIELVATR